MRISVYLEVLELMGWPNVYLVHPVQFQHIEGPKFCLHKRGIGTGRYTGSEYTGFASEKEPAITSLDKMSTKELKNNLIHENLHKTLPWKRHWWIECAAEKLARGGGRGYYSAKYNHTPDDLPPYDVLLKQIQRASKRYNRRPH